MVKGPSAPLLGNHHDVSKRKHTSSNYASDHGAVPATRRRQPRIHFGPAGPTILVADLLLKRRKLDAKNGGTAVEGWLIWQEENDRWLLANHHCVWRNSG